MQVTGFNVDVDNQLLDTALFYFAVTNKQLHVLTSNKHFQSTFGLSAIAYFKSNDVFEQAASKREDKQKINVEYQNPVTQETLQISWELTTLRSEKGEINGFSFLGTSIVTAKKKSIANYLHSDLVDQLSDAVVVTDAFFCINGFNKAAERIYHIKSEDAIGKRTDILNHQFEQTSTELAAKELLTNKCWSGEVFFIRNSDQKKIHLLSNVNAIKDSDNSIIGYVAVNRDVTKFRTEDQSLFSKMQLQNEYFDAFAPGLVIQDLQGKILFSNTASEKILGLTKDNLLGISSVDPSWRCVKKDFSPFPGNEHPAMVCLQTGMPVQDVIMGVYKVDGSLTWININSNPVINSEGKMEAVVSIFADVTTERNAYLKLEESENKIRTVLSTVGKNAWEHNLKTNEIWFSEKINPFIGYSNEEFQAALKNGIDLWWEQTHPDDRKLLIEADKEYKAGTRKKHSFEYRIYDKGGNIRWVLDRGVAIEKDEQGKPIRIVGTHTDISTEKNLQIELLKQKERKRKEIVEAVFQAQELEREQIATELHEEIAQVLSSLKLKLASSADTGITIDQKLKLANETIGNIINHIKDIRQNINSSNLKLIGLEQTIIDYINTVSANTSIQFITDFSNLSKHIKIDYAIELTVLRIVQEVLRNIILHSNATKAVIEFHSSKSYLQLFVRDDGIGFDSANEPLGLGFKNIFARAEQYGGNVEIVSEPGKGCLVQIILPVSAMDDSITNFSA